MTITTDILSSVETEKTPAARNALGAARTLFGSDVDHVEHGWHLIGVGPARFGWAAVWAGGVKRRFLARTASDAVIAASRAVFG